MQVITFKGASPKKPSIVVPGWGGEATNDQFQPWHCKQFVDAAHTGIELIYGYEDAIVSENECPSPFYPLSDMYYGLALDTILSTTEPLLILPHYRFYTDKTWTTPLPVACSWDEWWPFPFTVIFRHTPKPTIFKRGEPFAQVIPSGDCRITAMAPNEQRGKESAARFILENKDKYITRKWKTSCGTVQDNLYNVIGNLETLPAELTNKSKKFKLIWRQ